MAALIAGFDWSQSLGPIAQWPQSLKTAVGILIHSPVPIVLLWGADGIMIYNDGYAVFAGARHPGLLGKKVREGWPEVADFNDNVMKVGLAGKTLSYADQELTLHRSGRPDTAWLNLDYSPVFDESGKPAGVMAIVIETTARVMAERAATGEREKLTQMFREAPSFMALLDGPNHTFAFTNDAYQQLIGHRDVIGKPLVQAIPEIEGQGFIELLDKLFKTGELYKFSSVKVKLKRAGNGSLEERLLDLVYQPMKDKTGAVTGIFAEGIDVTEARHGEFRLKFLDELGRETAKSRSADQILAVTTRMVGEYLGVSNCAYADMDDDQDGFTIRGDWNDAGAQSIVGHYSLAAFGELAVEKLRAGQPLVIEDNLRELPPDAAAAFHGIGIAATICMPLVMAGRLTALMAIHDKSPRTWGEPELALLREVTERSWAHIERVSAEAEIKVQDEQFRTLAEAMPNHVWTATPDGSLDWFNDQVHIYSGEREGDIDRRWLDQNGSSGRCIRRRAALGPVIGVRGRLRNRVSPAPLRRRLSLASRPRGRAA